MRHPSPGCGRSDPSRVVLAMNHATKGVFLIEDDPTDAELIQVTFPDINGATFRVEWVACLPDALACLGRKGVEVIILDLKLADGRSLEVFDQVAGGLALNALILILRARGDEEAVCPAQLHRSQGYDAGRVE